MTCASCTGRIEQVVRRIPGVHSVQVQLLLEQATIEHDPSAVTVAELIAAINGAGFEAQDLNQTTDDEEASTMEFAIDGTSCCGNPIGAGLSNCEFCMNKIVRGLETQLGVVNATVDTKDASVKLVLDPRQTAVRTLSKFVLDMGFNASPKGRVDFDASGKADDDEEHEADAWCRLFVISCIFTIPVFLIT